MKLRSYAPALIAIVGLVGVYLWTSRRGEHDAAPPPATQIASDSTARPAAPALPSPTPRAAEPVTLPPPPERPPGVVAPTEVPHALTPEEYKEHEPKAKLPKMTLEERIAAAKEHVTVIERRVEMMQREIADLEQKGDKAKAEEQRVIMGRLTAHIEKLRKAIAEGRDPE